MSGYDNWRELAYDQQLDIDCMKTEIKRYERQLDDALKQYNEEHRLRLIADMNLKFADEKLRKANLSTQPFEVDDDGNCECGACSASLEPDWWACPGCGKRIDWDNQVEFESGNWYAEEGESFLQQAVYEPLRERML